MPAPKAARTLRITGGRARGIRLKTPTGDPLRPATGYLREAVFSALGPVIAGADILDCFAGSGAYGLEAWSRGARTVTFIEKQPAVIPCLRANMAAVAKSMQQEMQGHLLLQVADVWKTPAQPNFDVVIADPPYALLEEHGEELLPLLQQWLRPGGEARIVLEGPGSLTLPDAWRQCLRTCLRKGPRQPAAFVFDGHAG